MKVIDVIKNTLPDLKVVCFGAKPPSQIALPNDIELEINPAQSEIREVYQKCDVWLCCSTTEGFGLTVLEAMACRAPVVSTKCGGPEDIVENGLNGYLRNVGDVTGLAEAALLLLQSSEQEWLGYSNAAYEFAISYSWKDATKLFEQALTDVVSRK